MTRDTRIFREDMILNAGYVRRWHTNKKFNQNIAEHSWRMAALAIVRYPNISLNLLKAIILHDIGEYKFADIPSPIKKEHPQLKEIEEQIQMEFMNELEIDKPELSEIETKMLKMLDLYEAFCFVQEHEPEAEARAIAERLRYYIEELGVQVDLREFKTR